MPKSRKTSPAKPAKEGAQSETVIHPLADRVVIKPLSAETQTASGIIIPDTAKEKPDQGTVVAVGPGKFNEDGDERIPISVKVGDRVMFSKYGYDEIKIGGETYYVVSENNVLAILD